MEIDIKFDPAEVFDDISQYLEGLELSGGWEITYIQSGDITKQRYDLDNNLIYSAETLISKSPEDIAEVILDLDSRKKWDFYLEKYEKLQSWGKNLQLIHIEQKYKWPMSNRDFVLVQGISHEPGEKILIGWKSIDYENKPPTNSCVRGIISYSGFIITKVSETISHVTYIEKSDPAGSIPTSLIKILQRRTLNTIISLKEFMK
ncbi:hypothetical protein SteCoe_36770 [Stentor coeruleus]|uniref:START domain-containing protein n=1 Tax=Stentor coeruleus TaxID=5963 RepID=A0A1R2APC4_9CILI|nr:hypothetical protein SteCoe_36770 [Stentor coeruleus]